MNRFAIIVAGGSGSRMAQKTPKQFLPIGGKPILMHTIEKFLALSPNVQVLVVLPQKQMGMWHTLCEKHDFYPAIQTVVGGSSRFQSVKNGLKAIRFNEGLVAVHDGVRPFITPEIIENSFGIAQEHGTAVTTVSPKDSVRQLQDTGTSQAIDRTSLRLVQTPQTFRLDWIKEAFETTEQDTFTDCASVLEHAGRSITLIEGHYENIKVTTPEDLLWAEVLLSKKSD